MHLKIYKSYHAFWSFPKEISYLLKSQVGHEWNVEGKMSKGRIIDTKNFEKYFDKAKK